MAHALPVSRRSTGSLPRCSIVCAAMVTPTEEAHEFSSCSKIVVCVIGDRQLLNSHARERGGKVVSGEDSQPRSRNRSLVNELGDLSRPLWNESAKMPSNDGGSANSVGHFAQPHSGQWGLVQMTKCRSSRASWKVDRRYPSHSADLSPVSRALARCLVGARILQSRELSCLSVPEQPKETASVTPSFADPAGPELPSRGGFGVSLGPRSHASSGSRAAPAHPRRRDPGAGRSPACSPAGPSAR